MSSSFIVFALILVPQVAFACPVCGQAKENQRLAYIVSTGFMSFLPLLFMGGIVYWLIRRVRAHEAEALVGTAGPSGSEIGSTAAEARPERATMALGADGPADARI